MNCLFTTFLILFQIISISSCNKNKNTESKSTFEKQITILTPYVLPYIFMCARQKSATHSSNKETKVQNLIAVYLYTFKLKKTQKFLLFFNCNSLLSNALNSSPPEIFQSRVVPFHPWQDLQLNSQSTWKHLKRNLKACYFT